MKKELTKKDYDNYMKVVNQNIKETERLLNEGKKYEFIDEHPSFKELNSKIGELKKFMKSIGKDLVGGIDYVEEYVEEKLFNK